MTAFKQDHHTVAASLWNVTEILNISSTVAMAADIEKLNCVSLVEMRQDFCGSRTFKDRQINYYD